MDDNASLADALATALRYEGYTVEQVSSGRDALATVERFAPHLVILDWELPDVPGIEVTRRLRERVPQMHTLFLTANDAPEAKAEALLAGAADYILKPFSLGVFLECVGAILAVAE